MKRFSLLQATGSPKRVSTAMASVAFAQSHVCCQNLSAPMPYQEASA